MAALTSAQVSRYPTDISGSEWPTQGKDNRGMFTKRVQLNLTGQGTAANPIPASALGFTKLLNSQPLLDVSNSKIYTTVVDPVNNILLIQAGATFATADVTSAVSYVTVTGIVSGWGP
jgi:hypothetical protein